MIKDKDGTAATGRRKKVERGRKEGRKEGRNEEGITNQLLRRVGTKKYLKTSATPLNIQLVLVTHSSKLRMARILTA